MIVQVYASRDLERELIREYLDPDGHDFGFARPLLPVSVKRRHELANLSYGGNERWHRHRVRRNRLSRPPHGSFLACLMSAVTTVRVSLPATLASIT